MELGCEFLDLPLASMARCREEVTMVGGGEVRREDPDGREGHGAIREHVEDDREPPRGAGRLDAIVGGMLGEMEDLRTVGEERGKAFAEVEAAFVQDGEVADEGYGCLPLVLGEELDPGEEVPIGEVLGTREDIFAHRFHRMAGPARTGYAPHGLMVG